MAEMPLGLIVCSKIGVMLRLLEEVHGLDRVLVCKGAMPVRLLHP